jgi:hypothetical protein
LSPTRSSSGRPFVEWLLCWLILGTAAGIGCAQSLDDADEVPRLSPGATISLVTYSPGEELYTVFGHSAIRILDEDLGFDRLYNFGTFDFDTPDFYLRFFRGDIFYLLAVGPSLVEMNERGALGQGVTEQVFGLSFEQKQELFEALEINLRPANRAYLYDFLLDNCSTRIRDVFERVFRQPLGASVPAGLTYRQMLDPYLRRIPWVHFGLFLLLGAGVDRTVDARGACFLPVDLERAVVEAHAGGRPWVSRHERYFEAQPLPQPISALEPLPVFSGLVGVWLLIWGSRGGRASRRLSAFFFVVIGLTGCLILAGIVYSRYWVLHENWNLCWLFPLHAAAGVCLWSGRPRIDWLLRLYFQLSFIVTMVFALTSPWLPQRFLPAVYPLVALILWRSFLEARRR